MPEQALNQFCWNELATPDAVGSARFYSELFGWTPRTQPIAGTTYTHFQANKENDGRTSAA